MDVGRAGVASARVPLFPPSVPAAGRRAWARSGSQQVWLGFGVTGFPKLNMPLNCYTHQRARPHGHREDVQPTQGPGWSWGPYSHAPQRCSLGKPSWGKHPGA